MASTDVAVSYRRAQQGSVPRGQHPFQTQVRHDRGHHGVPRQRLACQQPRAQDGHDLVAVDNFPALVRQDHAVGVSVERDADGGTGAAHLSRHFFGMQGPQPSLILRPFGSADSTVKSAPSSVNTCGATR